MLRRLLQPAIRGHFNTRIALSSSAILKSDGEDIDSKAREDDYFYQLQRQQLKALKNKQKKHEEALQDEVDEIEGELAGLKSKLYKKKKQLTDLQEE